MPTSSGIYGIFVIVVTLIVFNIYVTSSLTWTLALSQNIHILCLGWASFNFSTNSITSSLLKYSFFLYAKNPLPVNDDIAPITAIWFKCLDVYKIYVLDPRLLHAVF